MHPSFYIRAERQNIRIRFDQLICIEAMGNYVNITTETSSYLCLLSLRQLESVLPPDLFTRVSRKSIISLDHIISFDREAVVLQNNKRLSFGDGYRIELEMRVNVILSDVRNKAAKRYSLDPIIKVGKENNRTDIPYVGALN